VEAEDVRVVKFLWKRKQTQSDELYTELEAEAKNILLLPHP